LKTFTTKGTKVHEGKPPNTDIVIPRELLA
jgi:hypothetical protein